MVYFQRANALECSCPPWVLHGEPWHEPSELALEYWAERGIIYRQAEQDAEAAANQPAGPDVARLVFGAKVMGGKPIPGRPN